ncbi:MAG: hypothetical protein KHW86_04710, partial [Porphyromonadaceae bacterium]|nr:hypothetical protein [Porphyromonadaceae bacterium]
GDFAKMFRMKNHFKILSMAVESGAGAAKGGGRVFWSGEGNSAVEIAAREFATKNGMTTLEMTRAGQNLTDLTKGLPWSEAGPMWRRMSAAFAKSTSGTVHVFQNARSISVNSV